MRIFAHRTITGSKNCRNDQPFTGSYDGAEYDISGLRVEIDSTIRSYGLFGMVNGSGVVLRNIRLQNPNVTGQWIVGGVAGVILGGNIMNCAVVGGSVTGDTNSNSIGGLIGSATNVNTVIEGSYATSRVASDAGNDRAGGLIGQLRPGTVVRNSYAGGAVDGGAGSDRVGGLVGYNGAATIENSYASGSVNGGGGIDQVGGLTGFNLIVSVTESSLTMNSYATGNVDGGADGDTVGGLVGVSEGGTIANSYATGNVNGGADDDIVGGLLGASSQFAATVTTSYHSGTITGETHQCHQRRIEPDGTPRSLVQLQCPTAPDATCGSLATGMTTYADWLTSDWNFGDVNTLPKVLVKGSSPAVEVGGQ